VDGHHTLYDTDDDHHLNPAANQLRHLRGQSPPRRATPQPPHRPARASQHFIAQFFISLRVPNHQGDDDSEPATGRQRRADNAIQAEEQPSPDHIDLANALLLLRKTVMVKTM
jgi:hypothetical protein